MKKPVQNIPFGWLPAGSSPQDYNFTLDTNTFHSEKSSGLLQSSKENPSGFGTLMQNFAADNYRGKRIKFSAFVKTKDVEGWAGLWMKVEGAGQDSLGFDNMKNRAITGTTDWKEYEIILDIPSDSKIIAIGILLSGKGSVWIDDCKFEEALDKEVTNMEKPLPTAPVNLNFKSN